jgi:hypothetical protein
MVSLHLDLNLQIIIEEAMLLLLLDSLINQVQGCVLH